MSFPFTVESGTPPDFEREMLDRRQSGLVKLASPNHADDDKQRRKYQIGTRAYRNR
jgi:hypothetical protein